MNARLRFLPLALAALALPAWAQHHDHARPSQPQATPPTDEQAQHALTTAADPHAQHDAHQQHAAPASTAPREPIPTVTDADRQAAFPAVHAHHMHGTSIHDYTLVDRLEWVDEDHGGGIDWEASGWIGGDVRKFLWRTEGHHRDGGIERAGVEALYGKGIRAWWDVVAGVRHDFGEGPNRTWLAAGVQGFAPYKFEVSATAYLGQGGRTALVAEAEYDTLLTNRLILQWRAGASLYGRDDPALGIGAGLSSAEAGLRLRYEFTRQFAPYVGIAHEHAFGDTADYRRAAGHDASGTTLVAGLRLWF